MSSSKTLKYNLADPLLFSLLKKYAKENKNHPTQAESLLWEYLKSNRLGKKFNRQHVIGPYIVDFVCIESRLVIEVDGGYHSEYAQIEKDENRTQVLNDMGFDVIRFNNEDVLYSIDKVIQDICKYF